VRCLGRFRCPAEGEEGAVEFLEQAQQVSGLLAQLWRAQPAAILPCLKELFAVISCTGVCAWGLRRETGSLRSRMGPWAGVFI
jgi:ubiquitin carboxyl-terminal hydrolase 35/38